MANSREFLNSSVEHGHALVPVDIELRDSLGVLAVHVLAARENLAKLSSEDMLRKLHDIIHELHEAYDHIHF